MDTDDAEVSDGVLNKDSTANHLQTTRLQPDPRLAGIVSHYRILRWNIPAGEWHTVSTLGRLGCSFVWTESESLLYGVQTECFRYELTGVGRITGAKLSPAGIRAYSDSPAHLLTDRTIDLVSLIETTPEVSNKLPVANNERVVELLDALLTRQDLRADSRIPLANDVVGAIAAQPHITQVSGIARLLGIGVRTMQKLMRSYAGAHAK